MNAKDFFASVSSSVKDRVEGIGEAGAAALLGAIQGPAHSGGITVGQNATGQPLIEKTPTGMAPTSSAPGTAEMPVWVKPVAVGVAVVVVGALVWRVAGK